MGFVYSNQSQQLRLECGYRFRYFRVARSTENGSNFSNEFSGGSGIDVSTDGSFETVFIWRRFCRWDGFTARIHSPTAGESIFSTSWYKLKRWVTFQTFIKRSSFELDCNNVELSDISIEKQWLKRCNTWWLVNSPMESNEFYLIFVDVVVFFNSHPI